MNPQIEDVINHLHGSSKPFKTISVFDDKPGIYALYFHGIKFPFTSYQPKPGEIIYIGKTESSQQSRDADTHFTSGKTGSSTLRRTFGSFLLTSLKLIPIPRGVADIEKGRLSHFKFDNDSENRLTEWMKMNLGLAFYPYPHSPIEIDELETQLIQKLIPVLNIDRKNPRNQHATEIKKFRKQAGIIAYREHPVERIAEGKKLLKSAAKFGRVEVHITGNIHKYEDIWDQLSSSIIACLKSGGDHTMEIGSTHFKAVGNRKSYSFNLEFLNGQVSNNIGGSAVARDLARVLESKIGFKEVARKKRIKISLDRWFILNIEIV